jgi:hypothetical protein
LPSCRRKRAQGEATGHRAKDAENQEETMSEQINPEAAQPSSVLSFELSDRNPVVTSWGGTDAEGGQIATAAAGEQRVSPGEAPLPADAGVE